MSFWAEPAFGTVLLVGYLGLMSLLWLLLWAGVPKWGEKWRLQRPEHPPQAGPRVSICIPARDEVHNIGACVRAALSSRWPNLEVIVVDDRSTDGTGEAGREAAAGDARFRLVAGTEPPAGWAGKAWACSRASGEAIGDYLLFLDADVQVHPDTLASLMAESEARGLDLCSAFGRWNLVSFWERALIPTIGWFIRGATDLDKVNAPESPIAFANGQLILVRRSAYEETGGHGAIRDQVLDDVRLAEAFKRRGHKLGLYSAPWAFEVRLYRNLREIIHGYSKNLYEGMGRRVGIGLGAILFILTATLLPWAISLGGPIARLSWGWMVPGWGWIAWSGGICLLQLLFRMRVEQFDGRSPSIAWMHPVANALLVYVLVRSVFGIRSQWKGRTFVDGRASER
jgi:chlorobactene glucosyltransferase